MISANGSTSSPSSPRSYRTLSLCVELHSTGVLHHAKHWKGRLIETWSLFPSRLSLLLVTATPLRRALRARRQIERQHGLPREPLSIGGRKRALRAVRLKSLEASTPECSRHTATRCGSMSRLPTPDPTLRLGREDTGRLRRHGGRGKGTPRPPCSDAEGEDPRCRGLYERHRYRRGSGGARRNSTPGEPHTTVSGQPAGDIGALRAPCAKLIPPPKRPRIHSARAPLPVALRKRRSRPAGDRLDRRDRRRPVAALCLR